MNTNTPISMEIDRYLISLKQGNSGKLPYGSYTKIAKRFGVSRELVRVRATKCDIEVESRKRREAKCPVCQKMFYPKSVKNIFCSSKCYKTHIYYRGYRLVLCSTCGKGILQTPAQMRRSKTKLYYCSHKCYAKSNHLVNIANKLKTEYGSDYYEELSHKGNEAQRRKENKP